MRTAPILYLRRFLGSIREVSARTWYELVLLPAILAAAGYAILRLVDGTWWGVVLWMMVAPILYLVIDFIFFSAGRRAAEAGAKRPRAVVWGRPTQSRTNAHPAPPPEWRSAQDVSTGSKILRRGRRYDHRA